MVDIKNPKFQADYEVDIGSRSIVYHSDLKRIAPINNKENALEQLIFIQNKMAISANKNNFYGWKYKPDQTVDYNFMDLIDHLLKKIEE